MKHKMTLVKIKYQIFIVCWFSNKLIQYLSQSQFTWKIFFILKKQHNNSSEIFQDLGAS